MLEIIYEPKLSERTTLRLGGKAIAEVRLSEKFCEDDLTKTLRSLGTNVFVLGAGSNLLVSDADIPMVFIRPTFNDLPYIVEQDAQQAKICVGSGVRLPRLLARCARWGLSGLEGLSGIPGTVGGAIAMNAGSFGDETCAHLHALTIYSPQTGVHAVSANDISYGYRSFSIAGLESWFFIIDATFILTQKVMNGIKKKMFHNFFKKKSTQPVKAWSAGCIFKNPLPDKPAGMLLEQCGFKGKELGGMRFSPIHANFLVNEGKGSATAALELMEEARLAVKERFDLELKPEVKILCP